MSNTRDTSTLSRWSRLKHESNTAVADVAEHDNTQSPKVSQDTIDAPVSAPATVDVEQVDGLEQLKPDAADAEPLLTDADMPELTTLTSQSDISMFFNKGVSTVLRKAALKYVFQLPQYNIRDGLNDYDEDYTYFEPLGDTVTCDMKFHKERKEREAREAEEQEALLQQEQQEQLEAENESEQLDAGETTEEPSMQEDEGSAVENQSDSNEPDTHEPDSPADNIADVDDMHADASSHSDSQTLDKNRADV